LVPPSGQQPVRAQAENRASHRTKIRGKERMCRILPVRTGTFDREASAVDTQAKENRCDRILLPQGPVGNGRHKCAPHGLFRFDPRDPSRRLRGTRTAFRPPGDSRNRTPWGPELLTDPPAWLLPVHDLTAGAHSQGCGHGFGSQLASAPSHVPTEPVQASSVTMLQLPSAAQHAPAGGQGSGWHVIHSACQMPGAAQPAWMTRVQEPLVAQHAPAGGQVFSSHVVIAPRQRPAHSASSVRLHSPFQAQQAPSGGGQGFGEQLLSAGCQRSGSTQPASAVRVQLPA
jgi:hypothetical protein